MILAKEVLLLRKKNYWFKFKDKDEPRVGLRHLAHYILSWIIYVDNYYKIYKILKEKYKRYLVRIYWIIEEKKY